jgi:hypothetical protein
MRYASLACSAFNAPESGRKELFGPAMSFLRVFVCVHIRFYSALVYDFSKLMNSLGAMIRYPIDVHSGERGHAY